MERVGEDDRKNMRYDGKCYEEGWGKLKGCGR